MYYKVKECYFDNGKVSAGWEEVEKLPEGSKLDFAEYTGTETYDEYITYVASEETAKRTVKNALQENGAKITPNVNL